MGKNLPLGHQPLDLVQSLGLGLGVDRRLGGLRGEQLPLPPQKVLLLQPHRVDLSQQDGLLELEISAFLRRPHLLRFLHSLTGAPGEVELLLAVQGKQLFILCDQGGAIHGPLRPNSNQPRVLRRKIRPPSVLFTHHNCQLFILRLESSCQQRMLLLERPEQILALCLNVGQPLQALHGGIRCWMTALHHPLLQYGGLANLPLQQFDHLTHATEIRAAGVQLSLPVAEQSLAVQLKTGDRLSESNFFPLQSTQVRTWSCQGTRKRLVEQGRGVQTTYLRGNLEDVGFRLLKVLLLNSKRNLQLCKDVLLFTKTTGAVIPWGPERAFGSERHHRSPQNSLKRAKK
eukprot:RCo048153